MSDDNKGTPPAPHKSSRRTFLAGAGAILLTATGIEVLREYNAHQIQEPALNAAQNKIYTDTMDLFNQSGPSLEGREAGDKFKEKLQTIDDPQIAAKLLYVAAHRLKNNGDTNSANFGADVLFYCKPARENRVTFQKGDKRLSFNDVLTDLEVSTDAREELQRTFDRIKAENPPPTEWELRLKGRSSPPAGKGQQTTR